MLREKYIPLNIALALIGSALCLALPRVDGDAAVYALLSKHMVQHGDWVNLVFQGADWLDKPHFPFWMVALSFKVFGITERAYLLPGLLFYWLGAWFTYLLARHFYPKQVAALASLLYLSLFGLLLGASDQKAEVYLLGLMTGASYAWLKFSDEGRWRFFWLGALCTGCALMTKGVFVGAILGAGLLAHLVYRRAWSELFHWKWLAAIAASLLFTAPELLALYLQFDARPELVVFGQTQVSGLKFFFWDSQFGRFLNTGPIQNTGGSPFFFVHNLVWTFFPWTVVLAGAAASALWSLRRVLRPGMGTQSTAASTGADASGQGRAPVYLWATFGIAFALFSVTKFQMDYYLSIVFPHAAIVCAKWLEDRSQRPPHRAVVPYVHLVFATLFLALAMVGLTVHFGGANYLWALLLGLPVVFLIKVGPQGIVSPRPLAYTLVSVFCLFLFSQLNHHRLYLDYNVGRQIALSLNQQQRHPVYIYNMKMLTFEFLSDFPALAVSNPQSLAEQLRRAAGVSDASSGRAQREPFYLLIRPEEASATLAALNAELAGPDSAPLTAQTVAEFEEIELPQQFVARLFRDDAKLVHVKFQVLRVSW